MLDWHEELIKLRRAEFIEEHGEPPEIYYKKKLLFNHDKIIKDGVEVLALYLIEEGEEEDVM
jgi:hypothetical protein